MSADVGSAVTLVYGRCASCNCRRGDEYDLKVVECRDCGTPWPKSYWTELAEDQVTLATVQTDGGHE